MNIEYCWFMYALDYEKPHVRTTIPGPKSLELMCKHAKHTEDYEFISTFIDLKRSKGNFVKDYDNNTLLDLVMNGGMSPLGYNHDMIVNAWKAGHYDQFLAHNNNFAEYPSENVADMIWDVMFLNQPKGLTEVHFAPT